MTEPKALKKIHEAFREACDLQILESGGISPWDITGDDVLCSQEGSETGGSHQGNQKFRQLAKEYCTRHGLSVQQRIQVIRENTGRFLKLDERSGVWYEMSFNEVEATTLAALHHAFLFDITDSNVAVSDVLCIPCVDSHFGNQKFQEMVEAISVTPGLLGSIEVTKVLSAIYANHGRFLKKVDSGMWQAMTDNEIKNYTLAAISHARARGRHDSSFAAIADSDTNNATEFGFQIMAQE